MVGLIRLVRVLLVLLLALFTLSGVIGIASPDTGVVEKVVLAAMVVACFVAAAKLSTLATTLEGRLRHH
jgi:hypothetical protein